MEYWLLFNTTISKWLVNMCYAYRFKKHTKMSEYHIEFDYDNRYRFELEHFYNNFFRLRLYHIHKKIFQCDFYEPTEFCKKIVSSTSPVVIKFVNLCLYHYGYRL